MDPSLSEAHKSLKEVVRMEIEVIFTLKQTVIENDMDMKELQRLIQGLAKENQLRLVLGPRSRLTYPHIIKLLSLIMISIIFTIHLHPDDNDHRVLLVRSVGDSLTNVGEALHPASRWGDFFIFYIFIFSYLHPASRWGIENQNCFSFKTAKKTISSGQGA